MLSDLKNKIYFRLIFSTFIFLFTFIVIQYPTCKSNIDFYSLYEIDSDYESKNNEEEENKNSDELDEFI